MTNKKIFFSIFSILSLIWRSGYAANILFLSEVASSSHHLWLRAVAMELANAGHNITFVSCDADVSQKNLHFIHMEEVYNTIYAADGFDLNFLEVGSKNILLQYLDTPPLIIAVCEGHLRSNGWKQLNNYPSGFKFDLIINDFMTGVCLLSFSEKFNNPPLISMTAFRDNSIFHLTTKTALIPSKNTLPYFYRQVPTSFLERIANFIMHILDRVIWNYYLFPKLTKMVQETNSFDYTVSVANDVNKVMIFLTNYDPAVDKAQQLPPNVIGVGGLQIKTPNTLPEDLQEIADNAVNGLILFSLGTNFHSQELGETVITAILDAFENFPEYTFLWKIDLEIGTVQIPSNVAIRKWVPQNDILAHKNTKLFITHGGLMSTQEAVWYAVPMLGIPIFFDQYSNIHHSLDKGIAQVIYFKDLTMENLCDKIFLMMTDPKYKENIQLFSNAFRDQKEAPLQRAIWWIEWVLRNPNSKIFEEHGNNLNFLQTESVDVISFLTIICVVVLLVIIRLTATCLNLIFGSRNENVSIEKKNE